MDLEVLDICVRLASDDFSDGLSRYPHVYTCAATVVQSHDCVDAADVLDTDDGGDDIDVLDGVVEMEVDVLTCRRWVSTAAHPRLDVRTLGVL